MAASTDELILLERVFLHLGTRDTDEELEKALCKFLPPLLTKLSSPQEGVRKKVMEMLIHINKRVKSRPQVQFPVETLLLQYQSPGASSFLINFTIIYIKLGYPRLDINKQAELIPVVLNAIEGKPQSHQDSLMLLIMPALGHLDVPMDSAKQAALLNLDSKPNVAKQLWGFMLDVLLLPYGCAGRTDNQQSEQNADRAQFPVPPGLSEYSFKRVIGDNPPTAEQLEQIKLGVVKFISAGFFPDSDILVHLIVAAADTRFSVANLADTHLKKIIGTLDWSSTQLVAPLYALFLGTDALGLQKNMKPEMKKSPASTRIRLKLLYYLCNVTKDGFMIPPCVQVVFDSLYGKNTNPKLKSLALQFTLKCVQQCNLVPLTRVAGVILSGMKKLIDEDQNEHKIRAYSIIGLLLQRIPSLVNDNFKVFQELLEALVAAEGEVQTAIRDTMVSATSAFVLNETDQTNITLMNELLSAHIESPALNIRFIAVHYAANVFPPDDIPSRYLLLLACGDTRQEISSDATKALYGVANKNDEQKEESNKIPMPDFAMMVTYIYSKMQLRISALAGQGTVDPKGLPYTTSTFSEIITYLRACLNKSANVSVWSKPLEHPCEDSPLISRYLSNLYKVQPDVVHHYLDMVLHLAHGFPEQIPLQALLEVVGTMPQCAGKIAGKETEWLLGLLKSTKPDIRRIAARIYGLIIGYCPTEEFDTRVSEMISLINKKNLESQHGALTALTFMVEKSLILKKADGNRGFISLDTYVSVVKTLCTYLRDSTALLMDAAFQGIGIIGRTWSLPLPDDNTEEWNKNMIVETLFAAFENAKLNSKVKENAVRSLGYLCIGEQFPYVKNIADKIIALVKHTKDIDAHLILGEALVRCVQGPASPDARDAWTTLPDEHKVEYSQESTELLIYVINQLLMIYREPHPNLRQATCVWMFTLVKHNIERDYVKEKFSIIHQVFMDFLCDDNDTVQDIAAKGLSLIHANSKQEEKELLVSSILQQFTQGRRTTPQVTPETKLFEEGELGKTPSSGNLSTYKEICSLATELQKPDLVYFFMRLVNHNAVWTSKKGAAFGFAAIANVASEELNKYLPSIIPRLYRYQYDPTPKIQKSMSSIWRAIVPSTTKAVELYHKEILQDIIQNLTNVEWRVRISCCNALSDLLTANVNFNFADCAPELWKKLFRVMDDIHEGTRLAATSTTKVLSKVCVRCCDSSHGKAGEELIQAILPVLLDIGVIHTVAPVRSISLQTVSQLVSTAGILLKPSLTTLIPALLSAIGESENPKLSYLSNVCGGRTETQETIDNLRANAMKSHYAADTITKCIQYIDGDVLKDLMPKVIDLIKHTIAFGTKIACSHFLILLSTHAKQELQPHAGKVLSALMSRLCDRNAAVRKNTAVTIGHIVIAAKESSLEKLFNTLNTWYMEREDEASRLAIGQTLQSINNYNPDVLKQHSNIVMPLIFFAMHIQKTPENEALVELWTDLWNEVSSGTEMAIREHFDRITDILRFSLKSASWTTKVQAANAVQTVAQKIGNGMDPIARNTLLKVLVDGLRGRTWNGKERLLEALATLTCNCKEAVKQDNELTTLVIQTLYRESKKESLEYRRHALQALATVLHELDIDKFTDVYDIAQEILTKVPNKEDDEDETTSETMKRREDIMKLHETVYEILGKVWPSCKETQDKYCIEFVAYCHKVLPNSTRAIQVSILVTLNLFVDKLTLLKMNNNQLSLKDKELLDTLCEILHKILKYSIGITKYTRIRKEALNIFLSLGKKLSDTHNTQQFEKLGLVFTELLPELTQDHEPEIRTRVTDIKEIFKG